MQQTPSAEQSVPFIPTAKQKAILKALEGRALRTDGLVNESRVDRKSLFQKPRGGIDELRERGLVGHHERLGYYNTTAPPPDLGKGVGTVQAD